MKTNIIIVDDIDVNRFLLKEFIKKIPNITISEATNGQECIDTINNDTKIIFMDVMMPILNGIEATKIIKLKHPHIIVIGVTGQFPEEIHNIFDKTLYKPYKSADVVNIVKNYLI